MIGTVLEWLAGGIAGAIVAVILILLVWCYLMVWIFRSEEAEHDADMKANKKRYEYDE